MKKKKIILGIIFSCISLAVVSLGVCFLGGVFNNSYTIDFLDNNIKVYTQEYNRGETIVYPTLPDKTGFNFVGWVLDNEKEVDEKVVVDGNKQFFAVWEKASVVVNFELAQNGSYAFKYEQNEITSLTNSVNVEKDAEISFDVVLDSAYSNSSPKVIAKTQTGLVGVKTTQKGNTVHCSIANVSDNVDIMVSNVKVNTYNLLFDLGGGHFATSVSEINNISYGSMFVIIGDSIAIVDSVTAKVYKLAVPQKDGNDFIGWENLSNALPIQTYAEDGNVTLKAIWSKNTYKVTLDLNGGYSTEVGEVSTQTLLYGSEINFPPVKKEGYTFAGWFTTICEVNKTIDLEKSILYDSSSVPAYNVTLYAGWIKN